MGQFTTWNEKISNFQARKQNTMRTQNCPLMQCEWFKPKQGQFGKYTASIYSRFGHLESINANVFMKLCWLI